MNYDKTTRAKIVLQYLFLGILVFVMACQPDEKLPPKPSEVIRAQREELGDVIRDAILADNDNFTILPRTNPYLFIYDYLDDLYLESYFSLRSSTNEAQNNRWDENRKWEIYIYQSPDKHAFCLPGGHFFASTGLLKSIRYEYELFYVMSFEASLMNGDYLFDKLVSYANNTGMLLEIIEDRISSTGITASQLALDIAYEITYDDGNITQDIDTKASNLICNYSIFDRFGIISLLDKLSDSEIWLSTRPSYAGREDYIKSQEIIEEQGICNNNTERWVSNSSFYRLNIANVLP